MKRHWILAAAFLPAFALAQEEATEAGAEDRWSGSATLGYLSTSGNTESASLNSGFEVGYTVGNWFHRLQAKAINSAQDDETIAEAYEAGWKTEYRFSETDFLFGRVDWRKDRFSGYDHQISETLGYGRRWIDTERHTLNTEIGVGARQLETQDGIEEEDFIVRGGLDYSWRFSETAEFVQELAIESGSENTFIESITALKATLMGDLALVASYTVRNNSDVPVGTQETDTFTALSLEYGF